MNWASTFLSQWCNAKYEDGSCGSNNQCLLKDGVVVWKPPQDGMLKINLDVAV